MHWAQGLEWHVARASKGWISGIRLWALLLPRPASMAHTGDRDGEGGLPEIPELIGDRDRDRKVPLMGVVVRHLAQRPLRANGELALQAVAPGHGHAPRSGHR